jgi:hypothetical protein
LTIVEDLERHEPYFTHRADALGYFGLRGIQNIASLLQILDYGGAHDANNEYIRIGESTASDCLHRFCKAVIDLYSKDYL